jgi:prepilin-type N-terminal cleavage/methylation domain-containing protein
MKTSSPLSHRGFSVPEMLAAIAIVVIIVSILLPRLVASRDFAQTAVCETRLHNLHQAYMMRQVAVKGKEKAPISPGTWQSALSPYLNGVTEVMKCPLAEAGAGGTNLATSVYLKVYNAYPNGYLYDMAMEPGPLCRQIDKNTTDAQIDQLWASYPSIGNTIKSYRNALPSSPYSYLLCFEDLRPDGGDKDYEDVIFKVTETSTGADITYMYDGAGYQFDLVSQDGTVIAYQLDSGGQTRVGAVIPITPGVASYGMNNAIAEKSATGKPSKDIIFMMDYTRTVCKGGWGGAGWDPWNDWISSVNGLPRFARHHGQANVMFYSGAVKLMDPALFDPKIAQYRTDFWIP